LDGSVPVVCIVGESHSGKTTLLEKLIPELKQRGYRVGVIKHTYRTDVQLDVPGKDSYRLAHAGADQVLLATPDRVVRIQRCEHEPSLEELAGAISDVDLILVEGHKAAELPKIEVSRPGHGSELISHPKDLLAIVSDQRFSLRVPQFDPDDAAGLANLLEGLMRVQENRDIAAEPQAPLSAERGVRRSKGGAE
jgi:molybdopterin-guanine dinucleotide biosynthesis protein MobB